MASVRSPSYLSKKPLNIIYEVQTDYIFSFSFGHGDALLVRVIYMVKVNTAQKGSAFIRHFPAPTLNTERYEVSLRIQPECGKIRKNALQNNSKYGHILSSVIMFVYVSCL